MASLSDKLKSLGVKVGTANLPKPAVENRFEIDTVVSGSYRSGRAGETFVSEQIFETDYHHGQAAILPGASFDALAEWAHERRFQELPLEAYAFLDTETSGLAGGTGTYAFLVGVGRFFPKEAGVIPEMKTEPAKAEAMEFRLQQFFMRDPAEEAALLENLTDFLAPCQALVTFNGKGFDAPLLATRYAMHDIPCPFSDYAHLDLLPLARRLWRDRLPSRALKFLEENVLGAPRTVDDNPRVSGDLVRKSHDNLIDVHPALQAIEPNAETVLRSIEM